MKDIYISRPSAFDVIFKWAAILFLVIIIIVVSHLWFFSDAAWFHTELLYAPEYVWTSPRNTSFLSQIRTVFDWSVFDSVPYRLRILSDLLEVIDAITRPATALIFKLHPSLTLTSLILAVLTGVFFYKALRHFGLSIADAALLTALFLTTIGYLSCFVSYIRPAKKATLFFICLSLYFIFRYMRFGERRIFICVLAAICAALFSDEAGYAFWGIATLFLLPFLIRKGLGKQAVAIVVLIPLFLILAKFILPRLYDIAGHSGPHNEVIQSGLVIKLLGYLVEPKFYVIALEELSRGALGTFGLSSVNGVLSIPFLVVFIGIASMALLHAIFFGKEEDKSAQWQVVMATVAVFCMSLFLTLINWFNGPFGYNYYGSMTYYYHSPVVIFALLWFAAVVKFLRQIIKGFALNAAVSVVLFLLVVPMAAHNYNNFRDMNRIIQTIHMFPLEPADFQSKMRALPAIVSSLPGDAPIPISLMSDPDGLTERFYPLSRSLLGGHSIDADNNLAHFLKHPIGTESYVRAYVRAFYPQRTVDVRITAKAK